MSPSTEHNYLGETLSIDRPDCDPIQATVAYHDNTDPRQLLLVCPPNPILGGDSQNNVVQALLAEAVHRGGIAVTFDYRGSRDGKVGELDIMTYWEALNASGDFSQIIADTMAVVEAVTREFDTNGCTAIAGYSFGSLIALQVADRLGITPVCCISPPLAEYEFIPWLQKIRPHLFVAPEDPFCPPEAIAHIRQTMDLAIHTVPSDDHFFRDHEPYLAQQVCNAYTP